MGVLARLVGDEPDDDGNMLRLPGRASSMPKDVRQKRDRETAIEVARVQVQLTRIQGMLHAGEVAAFGVAQLSRQCELAAGLMPEERDRVDIIADTVAAGIARQISELSQ